MRVIIAGGGTGGHLFPGIAIAEELAAREKGNEFLFVGTERGLEKRVIPSLGWPIEFITAEGIKGKGIFSKIRAGLKLIPGLIESVSIIRRFRPDAVIGVGGYASAPLVAAARMMGVKTAIHEQNALPGLTNRKLGRMVDRVFISFPEAASFFRGRQVSVTGNPLRKRIVEGLRDTKSGGDGTPSLLVFGGSLGAHRINTAMLEAASILQREGVAIKIVHQTGEKDVEMVGKGYQDLGWKADVRVFIDDMASAYAGTDLVICRAGATTISELAASGRPAILIPYPYAADDHQRKNAESLAGSGGAVMVLEKELTGESLAVEIKRLLGDRDTLERMKAAARQVARVDAAGAVVDGIYELVKGRGGVTAPDRSKNV